MGRIIFARWRHSAQPVGMDAPARARHAAPKQRHCVDTAPLAAAALLCLLSQLRLGADLPACLEAFLLVQHPLRHGDCCPRFAFFFACAVEAVLQWLSCHSSTSPHRLCCAAYCFALNVAVMLREGPAHLRRRLPRILRPAAITTASLAARSPRAYMHADPNGIVLMDTSMFPSIVPHAGMTYRQTINESDKEFYWAALGCSCRPRCHRASIRRAMTSIRPSRHIPSTWSSYRRFQHAQQRVGTSCP